jgi:hypothetical protein
LVDIIRTSVNPRELKTIKPKILTVSRKAT